MNCPLLYITQHALIPWNPEQLWRKTNQMRKAYEEGWKNKGQGNSCTTTFSLLHSYTQVWASLIITIPVPWHVVWMIPLYPPFVPLLYYVPPTTWWMYHGHTTPFRGWNHLIGSLINSLIELGDICTCQSSLWKGMAPWNTPLVPWFVSSFTWWFWWLVVLEGKGTH